MNTSLKTTKYSIEKIKKILADRPILLLSKKYKGIKNKHRFKCQNCNFEWKTRTDHILGGSGCPNCVGKVLTINDMIDIAHSRNFQLLSKEYKGCASKYKWQCENGHIWMARPGNIRNGRGCPKCKISVSEEKCRFALEFLTGKLFPKINHMFGLLELDGYCEKLKLAFEYQGMQHYEFIPFWHKTPEDFENQKKRDEQKRKECHKANIVLIEVPYTINKNNDTEDFLIEMLKKHKIKLVNKRVDWHQYKRKNNKMNSFLSLCSKRKIKCLGNYYPAANEKIKLQCEKCSHQWKTVTKCVRRGHGCPACGFVEAHKKKKLKRNAFDGLWEEKLRIFNKFIEKKNKMPSKHSKGTTERGIGAWIIKQKSIYKSGKMKASRSEKLRENSLIKNYISS